MCLLQYKNPNTNIVIEQLQYSGHDKMAIL